MRIFQFRELIFYRAYADLKVEAERTYLGVLWWVLEPIINMAVYYFVFSKMLNRGTEDFVPFLLIGLVTWKWFEATVNRGCYTIGASKPLILVTALPKSIFPASVLLVNTFKFAVAFIVLLIYIWAYGFSPNQYYVVLPALLLSQFLLVGAVTLPLSALVPFFPDLFDLTRYTLRLMFFLSGILFSLERIAPEYEFLLNLNPMYFLITSYRDILMYARWPSFTMLFFWGSMSLVGCFAGLLLFSKLDPAYAKRMVK